VEEHEGVELHGQRHHHQRDHLSLLVNGDVGMSFPLLFRYDWLSMAKKRTWRKRLKEENMDQR
jgi:hypothetical protein